MEDLIEKYILKHAEDREKHEVEKIKYEEEAPLRYYQEKHKRKCLIYDNILRNVSVVTLADKIGKAKFDSENYVVIYREIFSKLIDSVEFGVKELIYNFDPYNKGTIYQVLSKSLPKGYKIHVDEPWSIHLYQCVLYISWSELSTLDKLNLWF